MRRAVGLACVGLLLLVTVIDAEDGDLDDLIASLFTPSPLDGTKASTAPPVQTPAPPPPPGAQGGCAPGQRCIQKYLCTNASVTGEGFIDIRFDDDNPCVDYLLQCCYEEDIIQAPVSHSTPTSSDTPVTPYHGCGKRNPEGIGFRITGQKDNEAEYGEFPWMMAITKREVILDKPVMVYLCGGSLIHPGVVLTAAHCVQNKQPADLSVRGGEWDTQTKNEIYPDQDRNVAQIVVHPEYYKGGLHNDIALLFLASPMNLDEGIQTVCLPPQGSKYDFQKCYASGWGKDVYGKSGSYQVILKKIDLPIVPSPQCEKALKSTRLGPQFKLHNSFICAGGVKGKDTCKGDGGSPLVCPVEGSVHNYQQVGIVAWGIGCGENQIPGVYADVAHFRNWVDQEMHKHQLDTKTYTAA